VADRVGQRLGIVDRDLDVLGRERIGERRGLVQAATSMITPCVFQLSLATRAVCSMASSTPDAVGNGVGEAGIVGDQDRLRVGVVLGLAEQVRRRSSRGCCWPSAMTRISLGPATMSDADDAVELALRLGDPGVAGAGDHVRPG
jgi:hypothetical protein